MASCRFSLVRLAGAVLACAVLFFALPVFAAETTHINSIGVEFVLIPAGSFTMGADTNLENASDHESPAHRVTISKPFYLGKYEVTQAQWMAVMGVNHSNFKGDNNPVDQVSWDDIQTFIHKLNAKEGHKRYRLPTEAEWEYAARAGTQSVFSFGNDVTSLGQYAWYLGNAKDSTHPVGQKQPNQWGLYDMQGNVWEWVADWHEQNYYQNSVSTDPQGPYKRTHRVYRGGGWSGSAWYCRPACRSYIWPSYRSANIGFRLALSPE